MAADTAKPRVTLCLPVIAGQAEPQATLDAALAQSLADVPVVLALSAPDEALEGWCRTAAGDPRVSYSVRPEGGNAVDALNQLLFHATTEYVACLGPSDQPEPAWLERLLAALDGQREAVLADSDLRYLGRGRRLPPRPALSLAAEDAVTRVLSALTAIERGWQVRGLIRTAALARAGRIPTGDPAVFALNLAREGTLVRVAETLNRAPAAEDPDDEPEAWQAHCAEMTAAALDLPAGVQEMRFLWLAGVARLARPGGRSTAQREAAVEAFLTRMRSAGPDVPFLLDDDWDKIRRWTRGFAWAPRDRDTIVDFGPQQVNAGQVFNTQEAGGSAIWVRTEGRLAPGTRVKLNGRVLETRLDMNIATATVPPDMTESAGEYPLALVDGAGVPRSTEVTFWVLRATAFGRGMVRLLRRMRGLPEPGAVRALPKPDPSDPNDA